MTELEIKAAVRNRDGHCCQDCGRPQSNFSRLLHVHRLVPGSPYTVEDCITVCHGCHRRRHRKPPTDNVRVNPILARKARIVAAIRGISLSDYLNTLLRDLVARDFARALAEAQKLQEEMGDDS